LFGVIKEDPNNKLGFGGNKLGANKAKKGLWLKERLKGPKEE